MTLPIDLSGQRFGRLTVMRRDGSRRGLACWLCRCDCGREKTVPGRNLRNGMAQSCGCLQREVTEARNARSRAGAHRSGVDMERFPPSVRTAGWKAAYYSWYSMVQRCTKEDHPAWPNYGGRGITVCDRWLDFRSFFADMGEKPLGKPGTRISLERLDNASGYGPENCAWTDSRRQSHNRRVVKIGPELLREILALEAKGLGVGEIAQRVGYHPNGTGTILGTIAAIRADPALLDAVLST